MSWVKQQMGLTNLQYTKIQHVIEALYFRDAITLKPNRLDFLVLFQVFYFWKAYAKKEGQIAAIIRDSRTF